MSFRLTNRLGIGLLVLIILLVAASIFAGLKTGPDVVLQYNQTFGLNEWGPVLINHTRLTVSVYSDDFSALTRWYSSCPSKIILVEGNYQLPQTFDHGQSFEIHGRTSEDFLIGLFTVCGAMTQINRTYYERMMGSMVVDFVIADDYIKRVLESNQSAGVKMYAILSSFTFREYQDLLDARGLTDLYGERFYDIRFYRLIFAHIHLSTLPLSVN
jgi:hypothetical protein